MPTASVKAGDEACAKDPPIAHPIAPLGEPKTERFRYDESRRGVQPRQFAKPKPAMGLCPIGELEATRVGHRYGNVIQREPVRRQRKGRFGQGRSSESTQARAGG